MKGSQLFICKNRAFFSKLSNFYFDLRPPVQTPGQTPGQDRGGKNPTPGATRMCESPGVAREDGQAWN